MSGVFYFLISLLILALMIFIHELGHYTAGRLLGFKILDFSIGFGPAIFQFKKKDINYALRAIPLGGACRFYGEEDDKIKDAVAFNSQKAWKRLIVIFAGPLMNFILAYVVAVIMMMCYGDQKVDRYDNGDYAIVINAVTENGPAEKAGLAEGDIILAVGQNNITGEPHDFDGKVDIVSKTIDEAPTDGVSLTVLRDGKELTVTVLDIFNKEEGRNLIGITMGAYRRFERRSFFGAFGGGFELLGEIVSTTFKAIANGFRQGFNQGDVSGIVGTVAITMKMASMGFYYLLFIIVLISMSLGIMNLLPILPMDGGHLLFDFIELIVGKPVPRKIQNILSLIGIALLIMLMFYATVSDIKGLFNGMFNW